MAEFYSLLFVALLDPFDPYSPFKFLIFYSSLNILHTMYFSYVHIAMQAYKEFHFIIVISKIPNFRYMEIIILFGSKSP